MNSKFTAAYEAEGLKTKNNGRNEDDVKKARAYMCKNYYDVRTFGAVMSTGSDPCGIVRGPVQINFARSISPIDIEDITITRQARTTDERQETGQTEMERKASFRMHYIGQKVMYLLHWQIRPQIYQKQIWNFCGKQS